MRFSSLVGSLLSNARSRTAAPSSTSHDSPPRTRTRRRRPRRDRSPRPDRPPPDPDLLFAPADLDPSPEPPSRRAWRRSRRPAPHLPPPADPFSQRAPPRRSASSLRAHPDHHPAHDGPPSLRNLFFRAPPRDPPQDPHRRTRRRGPIRIRSDLDHLYAARRPPAPQPPPQSDDKPLARPVRSRRTHSLLAPVPQDPTSHREPVSLINDLLTHPRRRANPPPLFARDSSIPEAPFPPSHALLLSPSSSASSLASSTLSPPPSPPPLPPPPPALHMHLPPPAPPRPSADQAPLLAPLLPPFPPSHLPLDADPSPPAVLRMSADASYPIRRNPTPPSKFARNLSTPVVPATPSIPRVSPRPRRRPPPLRTPTDDATGFACGAGLNSGIIRVPLGRTSRDSIEEMPVQSDLRNASTVTFESSENRSTHSPSPVLRAEAVADSRPRVSPPPPPPPPAAAAAEAKAELARSAFADAKESSKFDIWSPEPSQNGSSGSFGSRFSRKFTEKEEDLFRFEEASQSSFGDPESNARRSRRNVIVAAAMDQRRMAEVQEDQFVFGADGSFNDGGFVISSNGVVEAPERLMRKTSDGAMVEGVPTSSNNVILVKSLDEFRKSYTFRSSTEGSSTLGRGSAGRVYLAHHSRTGRKIAVKEINVYDEEKRKQLRKELQTLISHQSRFLVRSFGAFYDGAGVVHVALEFMDRGSLADIVLQRGRIPEPVVCKLMEHCLRGLAFLHENHILHRDVKTANILLSRKLCRAKLSDFGLARDLEADNTSKTDSFVGTVAYMSPERLHGRRYTYASDIWSLGITVMECVMGKFPFDTPKSYFDIVDAAQSDPAVLVQNEEISNDCVDFIRLCLHADMQERPRARDLLQHEWIRSRKDDANVLREWLDTIPRLHCEDVKVGSELAFNAMEKQRARLRAKADFL